MPASFKRFWMAMSGATATPPPAIMAYSMAVAIVVATTTLGTTLANV